MTRPPSSPDERLKQLASLYGVLTSYLDADGVRRVASPEALIAVLRALGAPIGSPREVASALSGRHRAAWDRLIEPVLVAWDGRVPAVRLRLPQSESSRTVRWTLELERTGPDRIRTHDTRVASLPTMASAEIGGTRYVERQFELPTTFPPGYHRLRVEIGRRQAQSLIISAPCTTSPASTARRRDWGLFAPTYALHSRRSRGIGDFRDLEKLAAWAGRCGAAVVGTLPLHPTFVEQAGEISPYAPISRLFLNEIYINIESAPEFRGNSRARRLAGFPDRAEASGRSRTPRLVDYRRVILNKRRVLEELSRSLVARQTGRSKAFRRYLRANPAVADYARFRAVGERLGACWQEWPVRLREGHLNAADTDPAIERYHAYAQWLAHEQLHDIVRKSAAAGVRLYFDLPLGVHSAGYDVYRQRELFASGMSVGAPPDSFFTLGQNWGFPPLHPQRIRDEHHLYFIETIRHQLRYARLLRIDHVMGLSRLFLVPEGAAAADGVYVRYPEEELYAVLCLEARRARAEIIGEDLGTVPPEVRQRMDRHSVKRMYVLPLEIRDASPPLPPPPASCLATLNTHDMPPFASFWKGLDIGDRNKLGLLDQQAVARERKSRAKAKQAVIGQLRALGYLQGRATAGEAFAACMKYLASSRASLLLVNLEDMWLETRPQNTPGTVAERPNWRRKLKLSVEELTSTGIARGEALRVLHRLRPRLRSRSSSPKRSKVSKRL